MSPAKAQAPCTGFYFQRVVSAGIRNAMSATDKPLKMVTCPGCDAKVFIPGDLPPLAGTTLLQDLTVNRSATPEAFQCTG